MRYVTSAEMKALDRRTIEAGTPAATLMENAGKAVADEVVKTAGRGMAFVFCGYGNNGGDGLVAARHLKRNGFDVKVFFTGKARSLTPQTNSNLESLLALNIHPQFISKIPDIEKMSGKDSAKPDVVVDAIFGTGLKGTLDDFYIKLIDAINGLGTPVVAADIPSGLDADTGRPIPAAVKASSTVTFGYPKAGFKNAEAGEYIGKLIVADIGLDAAVAVKGKRPVIRIKDGKAGGSGADRKHPWIFRKQISRSTIPGSLSPDTRASIKPGDIVTIETSDGKFIGRGYYNPRSEISARILTFKDEPIDKDFFRNRIIAALKRREHLLHGSRAGLSLPCRKGATNAYRAVFSEADGLPGLIIDIYNDAAVFQILTFGMEKFKDIIAEGIKEILRPKYIYEKSVSPFRKLEGLKDLKGWRGEAGSAVVEIFEGKARFLVDIENGHKTGFYLDQRKSRLGLEGFCKGKTVLDLFCYTGAFSVSAALHGARSAEGVDIKDRWLDLARENARLNGVAERTKFVKGDAFLVLKNIRDSGRKFDIIILDPPSFLSGKESLKSASKGYLELNTLAMKTLADGGVLATFSCSHNMPNEVFSRILKDAARNAGKKITILKRCHQAEDHPIVRQIPETEYLKGYFLKVAF